MIAQFLLDSLWQGALVVAFAAIVTTVLPKRNAATRYAVWFIALLALPIVPIVTMWHPAPALVSSPVARMTTATAVITAKASSSGAAIAILWLCGFVWSLARLAFSYARIRGIIRDATPAPHLGADVVLSDDVAIPIAAGIVSPVVVVPVELARTLDPVDLDIILRHERAHVRRGDVAGNLIQRLIESVLFFNPWAYVVGRRLVVEREAACDDWAIFSTNHSDRYAMCLAQLARDARRSRTPILTPSALGPRNLIVGRIARLLNGKVPQLKINYFVLGASVALFAALGFALQPPKVVAAVPASTGCDRDAAVVNPAMPNIPSTYRGNAYATALVAVAANGSVISAKIEHSSGYAAIDGATLTAAEQSTYSPAMHGCKAIAGLYLFQVRTKP